MQLQLLNSTKKIDLAETVFAKQFNEPLIHQVVTAYMAGSRAGTKAQKTRAEVRGGGAKPWKQKGTGRARAGTIRSPIWRTGGIVFAAKPRCYAQKVNKKMYRGAFCSILSELIRQNRFMLVDSLQVDSHRTKDCVNMLKKFDVNVETDHVLLMDSEVTENSYLSARNLHHVAVLDVTALTQDPVILLKADKVIVTEAAVKRLEEILS